MGKCVSVHSAPIITTSVISRAGCVRINRHHSLKPAVLLCRVMAERIKQGGLRKPNLPNAGDIAPWILLEGLKSGPSLIYMLIIEEPNLKVNRNKKLSSLLFLASQTCHQV